MISWLTVTHIRTLVQDKLTQESNICKRALQVTYHIVKWLDPRIETVSFSGQLQGTLAHLWTLCVAQTTEEEDAVAGVYPSEQTVGIVTAVVLAVNGGSRILCTVISRL